MVAKQQEKNRATTTTTPHTSHKQTSNLKFLQPISAFFYPHIDNGDSFFASMHLYLKT
jgi:hypothetical protein